MDVTDFGATGDGTTDDSPAIQAAWDAMVNGGTLLFPPGDYRLATGLTFATGEDINDRTVTINAAGAVLLPVAGITALTLTMSHNPRMGGTINSLKVDGQDSADTRGVVFHNSGSWQLFNVWVEACSVNYQWRSDDTLAAYPSQPTFAEGNVLVGCWSEGGQVGVDFVTAGAGTGSFAQTQIQAMKIRHASNIGLRLQSGGNLHRSLLMGITIFVQDGKQGVLFDGNLDEVKMAIATEAPKTPSATTTHVEIGPNATNTDKVEAWLSFTGTGPNQDRIRIASGKTFPYREGGRFAGTLEVRDDFFDNGDQAIQLGGVYIYSSAGNPEGTVIAPPGSMYLRTVGAPAATLYVKESGAGDTGWVAK